MFTIPAISQKMRSLLIRRGIQLRIDLHNISPFSPFGTMSNHLFTNARFYTKESGHYFNVTPKIHEKINRKIHLRENHPLSILKRLIEKHLTTNQPEFKVHFFTRTLLNNKCIDF